MTPKKRIFMIGYSTDKGGVESYIRNLCTQLENEYDIVLHWPVMEIDGKHWELPRNRHNILKYRRFWKRFFRENHFDAIYYNTCDIVSVDMLKFGLAAGISKRIIHSHNTGIQMKSRGLRGLAHRLMERHSRKYLDRYASDLLACSKSAGDWMFDGRSYSIIKNGIDIERYRYSDEKRRRTVGRLGANKDSICVAAIGRLDEQKNPFFALEVFREICWKEPNAICLFIGDGEHREALRDRIISYGLEGRIIMTGGVDNVYEWLSGVDALIMPSFFEGLPFALVEAQAAGIRSLVSDTVSPESNITGLVEYKSLVDGAVSWASRAISLAKEARSDVSEALAEAGFSIRQTAETVKAIINRKND